MCTLPFTVDRNCRGSLISQIVSGIEHSIETGLLRPGDALPSQEEIAAALNVSIRVVRIACGRLVASGVIRSRPRVGSVVLPRRRSDWRGSVLIVMTSANESSYYQSSFIGEVRRLLTSAGYNAVSASGVRKGNGIYDFRSLDGVLGGHYDFALLMPDTDLALPRIIASGIPFAAFSRDRNPIPSAALTFRTDVSGAVSSLVGQMTRLGVRSVEIVDFEQPEFTGFSTALRKAGMGVREWMIPLGGGAVTLEKVTKAAMSAFSERFAAGGELPDLFVFTDDFVARGALLAFAFHQIRIPDDVRVVTLSSRGNAPVYPQHIGRVEHDPVGYGRLVADRILAYLERGGVQKSVVLEPVFRP